MLTTQQQHLLEFLTDDTKCMLTHILQTWLHHSTTLLDIKEHHLTMLVCSTAHTFHYKWFVQLGNTLSNQKSVLKLDMVSQLTHSTQEQLQLLLRVRSPSLQILTSITEELKLQTSCNQYDISVKLRGVARPLFFLT